MAREMRRASFCFVPPGDSATSSRLYDAITSLCIPVVIIGEPLLVPSSPHWTRAVVAVNASDFLRASPKAIVSLLQEQAKRRSALCQALSSLRGDLGAGCVLTRAILAEERSSRRRKRATLSAQSLGDHIPFASLAVDGSGGGT